MAGKDSLGSYPPLSEMPIDKLGQQMQIFQSMFAIDWKCLLSVCPLSSTIFRHTQEEKWILEIDCALI